MTFNDVITRLDVIASDRYPLITDSDIEALKIAMDIVKEKESTTKNNLGVDCIDRNSIKYYSGQGGYMYASKGEIDKLPSVTPQSKTGKWISNITGRHLSFCSECGEMGVDYHNFCPSCGADMREVEE